MNASLLLEIYLVVMKIVVKQVSRHADQERNE